MEAERIKSWMNSDFATLAERLKSVNNICRYTHRFELKGISNGKKQNKKT